MTSIHRHYAGRRGRKRRRGRGRPGLATLVRLYALGVFMTIAATAIGGAGGGIIAYLAAGVALSRRVDQVLRYHPLNANLRSVAKSKLWLIARWPLGVPMLTGLAFINRHM